MRHLLKVIREDNAGNARCVHISGLLKKDIILRRSRSFGFKKGDFVSCGVLNLSTDVYFVGQKHWRKVNSLEERYNLASKGEIKRVFYDFISGDVLVTGEWNNLREFGKLGEINRLKTGLLNEEAPLMYFYSLFAKPSRFYESFNGLKNKTVVASFGGKLPGAIKRDKDLKSIVERLSSSYS
jgi:hypothetical protein